MSDQDNAVGGEQSKNELIGNDDIFSIERRNVLKGILGSSTVAVGSSFLSKTVDAAPTPLASYDFEGSGTTIDDQSGNGVSGTLSGASRVSGRGGSVLEFDRDNQEYAELGTADTLDPREGSYTVSFWFHTTAKEGSNHDEREDARVLFAKRGSTNERVEIKLVDSTPGASVQEDNALVVMIKDDSGLGNDSVTANQSLADGNWHHVVAVRDSDKDELRLHLDDELVDTATDNQNDINPNGAAYLGAQPEYPYPEYFTGRIDDVKIYDVALTPEEIPSESLDDSEPKIVQSFEENSVGDRSLENPWYVFNDAGLHEIVDSPASDGDNAFRTANAPLGDASAIAIDLDLSKFDKIQLDVYAKNNNPNEGNIKVSLDNAGYPVPDDLRIWDFPGAIDSRGGSQYGGENRWWRDFEVDLSDRNEERSVIFWVDGDNDAVWDNIRFYSSGDSGNEGGKGKGKPEFYTISIDDIYESPVASATVWVYNVPPLGRFNYGNPDKIKLIAKGKTDTTGKLTLNGPDSDGGHGTQTEGRALLKRLFDKYRKQYDGNIIVHALASTSSTPKDRIWFKSISRPIDSWFPEDGDPSALLVLNKQLLYNQVSENNGAVAAWRTINSDDPTQQDISIEVSRADNPSDDVGVRPGGATVRVSEDVDVNYTLSKIEWTGPNNLTTNVSKRTLAFARKNDRPSLPINPLVGGAYFERFNPGQTSEIQREAARGLFGYVPVLSSLQSFGSTLVDIFDLDENIDYRFGTETTTDPNTQDLVTEAWNRTAFSFLTTFQLSLPPETEQDIATRANWKTGLTVTAAFDEEFSINPNPDGPGG